MAVLTVSEFRKAKSTKDRTEEAEKVRARYPDRVPVVACPDPTSRGLPPIDRQKFLVPTSLTVGEMSFVIRKRMRLDPSQALFVFCEDGTLPRTSTTVSDIYNTKKSHDSFLYLVYATENTFG